jgi:hypothetical protein
MNKKTRVQEDIERHGSRLFDHRVGSAERGLRNIEVKCLGGLRLITVFEFCRRVYWQFCAFRHPTTT